MSSQSTKTNAQQEAENTSVGVKGTVRILVVINSQKSLSAALSFIEKQDYEVKYTHQVIDMVKSLGSHKPHVVLLSWNLKGVDVKKVYRLLTQRFKITCIVFAEETNKRTTSTMMNSGIPHFLLSPVNGPNIHTRIQSLLRPKYKRTRPIKSTLKLSQNIPVESTLVPSGIKWEETQDPQDPYKKIWKGTSTEKENYGGIFFFKGPKPPSYDSKKKQWTDSEGSTIFFEKNDLGQVYSMDNEDSPEGLLSSQETFSEENISSFLVELEGQKNSPGKTEMWPLTEEQKPDSKDDRTRSKEIKNFSIEQTSDSTDFGSVTQTAPMSIGPGQLSEADTNLQVGKNGKVDSVLAKAIKLTYTRCANTLQSPIDVETKVTKVTVCTIDSPRFCGYLVCVSSIDDHQSLFMKRMNGILKEELSYLGEVILKPMNVLEIEMLPTFFLTWAREKSDFYVTSKKTGLGLAFFSAPDLPEPEVVQDPAVLGISTEKHLVPDTEILFDVFIHLPKNQKYLRYLKKGQTFSVSISSKFAKYAVDSLYVQKDQRQDLLTYWAKNFLTSPKSD
jgi:DNA-binding NarL/FixJ family response regulator